MKTTQHHSPLAYPKTPQTARMFFKRHGICVLHWSQDLNLPYQTVMDALRGRGKGRFGETHKVFVALGFKPNPEKLK